MAIDRGNKNYPAIFVASFDILPGSRRISMMRFGRFAGRLTTRFHSLARAQRRELVRARDR